jgi:hypothetical protein
MRNYLNNLLKSLFVLNVSTCFVVYPFNGNYNFLEIVLVIVFLYFILNFYNGNNLFLVFIKTNEPFHKVLFITYLVNMLSLIMLLILDMFFYIPLESSVGILQSLIQEFILNFAFCADNPPLSIMENTSIERKPDAIESSHIASRTLHYGTSSIVSMTAALNLFTITKKLSVPVKLIPISLSALIGASSGFSIEYKRICNIYPHELGFRYIFNHLHTVPKYLEHPINIFGCHDVVLPTIPRFFEIPLQEHSIKYLHLCYIRGDLDSIKFFLEYYCRFNQYSIDNVVFNLIHYNCLDYNTFQYFLVFHN